MAKKKHHEQMTESYTCEWETPPEVFKPLDEEFHFDLDVCATRSNRKCKKFYSKEDDGLSKPWQGVCWMNPPYGREINKWAAKAAGAADAGLATTVACLPARVDTRWFHDTVWDVRAGRAREGVELRFIRGRVRYINEKGERMASAKFPNVIVIWRAKR